MPGCASHPRKVQMILLREQAEEGAVRPETETTRTGHRKKKTYLCMLTNFSISRAKISPNCVIYLLLSRKTTMNLGNAFTEVWGKLRGEVYLEDFTQN